MRHKWKKQRYKKKLYPYFKLFIDSLKEEEDDNKKKFTLKIGKTEECVNCGLRKGKTKELGFYPVTVYFDEDKVLSENGIPFSCTGIKIREGAFFDESEFNL